MATTQEPVLFCNVYPNASAAVSISLPFGMPTLNAPDITCEGLSIFVSDLTASLSAFYPVIRIVDCALKIVDVLNAIPDSLGPPPDPSALISKIAALADCVTLFLSFTGVDPTPFCKFIRDLCNIMIQILTCISNLLTVKIENDAEIEALNASADATLQLDAACLQEQNNALNDALKLKFDSMKLVITLLNAIVSALPPVKAIIGDISPGSNDFTPEAVTTLLDVLTTVRDLAASCAGG